MTRQSIPLALALCLIAAACNQPAAPQADPATAAEESGLPAATQAPAAPPTSAAPTPTTAPVLVPEAEKGEKGARNILLEWARAIERGDWARAASQYGLTSPVTAGDLKAQFGPLGKVTVSIGDGDVEGAAGSLYYGVPFTASGNGRTLKGEVVVRRVNDVDGASAAQLRWHIESVTFQP